ncbi:CBS domain-containing protein, partial [Calothrix rhizosoleniae]|uniref:CBS domain-containing protein n=1 Tax=Calothrix rhizosoleniae TaxID=888997 RepID=UPI000B49A2F0
MNKKQSLNRAAKILPTTIQSIVEIYLAARHIVQQNNIFSLEQVIDRHPLIISPETPLTEVIGLMQEWGNSCDFTAHDHNSKVNFTTRINNSCALVAKNSQLQGIFTERDLVKIIAAEVDIKEQTVGEVMSQQLITLTPTDSQDIFIILNLLRQNHIRHLPVVDNVGCILGLVTEKGIRQNLQPINLMKWQKVEEVMDSNVIHALPTVSIRQTAQLMAEHGSSYVVIVESEREGDGLLIPRGIITERDIVQFQTLNLDLAQPAQVLMSAPLFLVSPEDSLWTIHQLMQQRRVRRLVVGSSQGEIQGIVTQTRLLQVFDPTEMYGIIELLQGQVCQLEIEKTELLESRNQELEEQVRERTSQLTRVNQQLQQEVEERIVALQERQQAEARVRQQAALLDVATDAIMVLGQDNQILFWNRGAERLYGWTKAEALNRDVNDLLYGKSATELAKIQPIFTQQGEWQGELNQVTKAGKGIVVESRWTFVENDVENPQSILVVNTDITEKKHLEAQYLHAQRLESLGTLAGGIAHDLNNILTPILGLAQLLPRKLTELDEPTLALFQIIETNAKRGAALVKQILTFSRGLEGERRIIQVEHLITEVKQIVVQTFPKAIEFEAIVPQNLWTVNGDVTQIHQVLMNLTVNGRDAMPNGGKLKITAENVIIDANYARMHIDARKGRYVVITVSDTGTGISPEILERVFEPFFTTKEVGRGTGLGLATALGIVKSHDGFVNAYSQVGRGTQFKVYLPACETQATVIEKIEELPCGDGELILVVDDEEAIREISKAILETHNYRVLTASDGIEAIALYAQSQNEIDAVLIDMMMPSMGGKTAIRTLKKINPQVKIIAVSGLVSN